METKKKAKPKEDKEIKRKISKIMSSKGVVIDTSDDAYAGGIVIDFS